MITKMVGSARETSSLAFGRNRQGDEQDSHVSEASSIATFPCKGAPAGFTGRWMCVVAKDVRLLLEEQLGDTLDP